VWLVDKEEGTGEGRERPWRWWGASSPLSKANNSSTQLVPSPLLFPPLPLQGRFERQRECF